MKFNKKLIPHIFMSKDDFPPGLEPEAVLRDMYDYIESWKKKLFDVLSTGMSQVNNHYHMIHLGIQLMFFFNWEKKNVSK